MLRRDVRNPSKNEFHNHKIHTAGEVAEKGSYVCWHCNRPYVIVSDRMLQLCPACFGRHFIKQ